MEKIPDYEDGEKRPKSVITEKGSRYTYLSDGRIQRFKMATGETFEPMDVLFFVPPLSEIPDSIKERYPHIFTPHLTEEDFSKICLSYTLVVPVFGDGTEIKRMSDIGGEDSTFLYFIRDNKRDFHLPILPKPRIGYYAYDRKVETNERGERMHQHHFGHSVSDIEY